VMSRLRFRPQPNRAELVAAMADLVRERDRWAGDRQRLRDEAVSTFPARLCVRRHASVLSSVARGEPVPDFAADPEPAAR
jgi:hypothetical protein